MERTAGRIRSVLRTGGTVLAAVLAVTLSSGCGLTGVTDQKLQGAVATSFAHLYVLQQDLLHHPTVHVQELAARAKCHKGGPATPNAGAGNDWRCVVSWRVSGVDSRARAIYRVDVRPDGRFIADGEGPRQVNGRHNLASSRGTATNPLWQFDGVLDIS